MQFSLHFELYWSPNQKFCINGQKMLKIEWVIYLEFIIVISHYNVNVNVKGFFISQLDLAVSFFLFPYCCQSLVPIF